MRIAFITLFKEGFGGGEGRVAHEIARYFSPEHDVVLICPGERTGLYKQENGLKVFGVQSAGEGNIYITSLSGKHVNKIFEFLDDFQPEVVHTHEPYSLALIGQMWAKMHSVPFFHTAHVLPSKTIEFGAVDTVKVLRNPFGPLSESLLKQISHNFYENCDAIVALNHFATKDIRQYGYEGRIFTIPNGRDLARYGVCANADLSSQERILTFIGKLNHRKNQLYLLETLQYLGKEYKLQLVGEPLSLDYYQHLQEVVAEHNLNVVFTGEVAHTEIPSYLEKTHVFVSASTLEVQSLVILEALASGTPIVGLSNETTDDLVDKTVGFRLPQNASPEVFARYIEKICNLPQSRYNRFCQNARNRVHGYDWTNVMALTIDAYQTLQREMPPITEKSKASLTKMASLLPSGEVRDILLEHAKQLEETIQSRKKTKQESKPIPLIKQLSRVPKMTWLFVAITIPICTVWYLFLKYFAPAAQRKRFRASKETLKSLIKKNAPGA